MGFRAAVLYSLVFGTRTFRVRTCTRNMLLDVRYYEHPFETLRTNTARVRYVKYCKSKRPARDNNNMILSAVVYPSKRLYYTAIEFQVVLHPKTSLVQQPSSNSSVVSFVVEFVFPLHAM